MLGSWLLAGVMTPEQALEQGRHTKPCPAPFQSHEALVSSTSSQALTRTADADATVGAADGTGAGSVRFFRTNLHCQQRQPVV